MKIEIINSKVFSTTLLQVTTRKGKSAIFRVRLLKDIDVSAFSRGMSDYSSWCNQKQVTDKILTFVNTDPHFMTLRFLQHYFNYYNDFQVIKPLATIEKNL